METVRRATSVPLRHNSREDATSVERDINSTPILPRDQSSGSIPISDPVARTLSRGSPYQIGNYKLAPKRPSETTRPNLSKDTKTQIRTPLLANKIGLPTFRRPHSNPNLTNEKRTYTSSGDVIGTKKLESEPELSRDSKSAQSVKRFSSAPVAQSIVPIPATNVGIHGFNTLTSTPNDERAVVSNSFPTPELTTSIITQTASKQTVLESTLSEMRTGSDPRFQLEPKPEPQPDYLLLIQNLLASKKSNFTDTTNQSDVRDSVTNYSPEVAQIVSEEILSNLSSLSDLGVELANQIRSGSDSGASTQRHNSYGSLGGKSTSVTTAETVFEALRYNPRHRNINSNKSEVILKDTLPPPIQTRYKSEPSVIVSRATREPPYTDTMRHNPSQSPSSCELVNEDSFQVLSDRIGNTRNGPMRTHSSTYNTPLVTHFERNTDAPASNQISGSSSVSFIELNSQLSHETESLKDSSIDTINTSPTQTTTVDNKQTTTVNDKQTTTLKDKQTTTVDNKQTSVLALSPNKDTLSNPTVQLCTDNNQFPRFAFSDFITPTNPFSNSTFLTDMDSQLSLPSVQPHSRDLDTTVAPFQAPFGTHSDTKLAPYGIQFETHSDTQEGVKGDFPIENIPSHYTIDLCKVEGETEEDTFLPLTPSEFQDGEDNSLGRELEIVSLPQSSVASPTRLQLDTIIEENIICEDKNIGTEFDIQNETSFEYIQRFVSEVRKFMEKRAFHIPSSVSKDTTIPVPPSDTSATSPLPPNLDQLITEMARQKLDELWENYLHNKSDFSDKPRLTRRHNKVAHAPPDDSTLSGYNTKMSSSFSDTTLFTPRHHKATHKSHLVLRPRGKKSHKRGRVATTFVTSLATQTQPAFDIKDIPDSLQLSVKQSSVAFLVTASDTAKCVGIEATPVPRNMSLDMTLQEACKSCIPRFVTNSNLRQVALQNMKMCRREMAQMCLVPTENKYIQTQLQGHDANLAGTFMRFRRKLTREEIHNQNKRWRSRFPVRRMRDQTKVRRERGHSMLTRVKTFQREILDPVRKALPLYRN